MILNIVSPEKVIYKGEAELVVLPGIKGEFTILERHAPVISILSKGHLIYRISGENRLLNIKEGFIEKRDSIIILVCIE